MFQLIGPYAGGWFTVISDNQIGRDEIDLSEYHTIYLPEAEYQRREIVKALADWVERGGRLIVTDPQAFTWHLDGTRMVDLRGRLFPSASEPSARQAVTTTATGPVSIDAQLPVFADAMPLQLADGDDTALLEYEDGSVAAASRPVGKGEVWYFGFEPMGQPALGSGWVDWWRGVHRFIDEETDLPIWRFMLPPVEDAAIRPPVGRCVTGNYVAWDTNEAVPMSNLEIEGSYSYSVAPDWGPDEGGVENVSFADGDLVDRRSALGHKDENYAAHLRKFAAGWKTTDPITIEFDLGRSFKLDRVWLLTGRSHPPIEVTGLVDGRWVALGSVDGFPVENVHDFPERIIKIADDAPAVQQLRLQIPAP